MPTACPYRTSRMAKTIAALAVLLLSGCAAQLGTISCGRAPFYGEAGTNLVIAPPSGSSGTATREQLGRIGTMIQVAATSVGTQHSGVKVLRLSTNRSDDTSCRPEAIRYMWSGCSASLKAPTLISGEPVTIVWPNAAELGDSVLVQFGISSWRVRENLEVSLAMQGEKGAEYPLVAHVPIDDLIFEPRRIPLARVAALAGQANCTLLQEPRPDAPPLVPATSCSDAFDGAALAKVRSGGSDWLQIKRGGAIGWLAVPDRSTVLEAFPEFQLLALIVAYQQYIENQRVERSAYHRVRDSYRDVVDGGAARTPLEIGTAEAVMAAADFLNWPDSPESLGLSSQHIRAALKQIPGQTELLELQLLIQFAECCAFRPEARGDGRVEASLGDGVSARIDDFVVQAHGILKSNPAASRNIGNVVSLLKIAEEQRSGRGRDKVLIEWRQSLERLLKTRIDTPQSTCDAWRSAADRAKAAPQQASLREP